MCYVKVANGWTEMSDEDVQMNKAANGKLTKSIIIV